jgi:hypothetical protein
VVCFTAWEFGSLTCIVIHGIGPTWSVSPHARSFSRIGRSHALSTGWESAHHRYLFIRTLGNKDDSGPLLAPATENHGGLWMLVALA